MQIRVRQQSMFWEGFFEIFSIAKNCCRQPGRHYKHTHVLIYIYIYIYIYIHICINVYILFRFFFEVLLAKTLSSPVRKWSKLYNEALDSQKACLSQRQLITKPDGVEFKNQRCCISAGWKYYQRSKFYLTNIWIRDVKKLILCRKKDHN